MYKLNFFNGGYDMKETLQKLKGLFVHVVNPAIKETTLSPAEIKARIKKRIKLNPLGDDNKDQQPKP